MKIARVYKKFYRKAKSQADKERVVTSILSELIFFVKEIGDGRWKHCPIDTIKTLDSQFTIFADYVNDFHGKLVINREEFRKLLVEALPNGNTKELFDFFHWDFKSHYQKVTGKKLKENELCTYVPAQKSIVDNYPQYLDPKLDVDTENTETL